MDNRYIQYTEIKRQDRTLSKKGILKTEGRGRLKMRKIKLPFVKHQSRIILLYIHINNITCMII